MNNNINRQLDLLDLMNIASFCIGLMNLNENVTQGDKQDLMQELNTKSDFLLTEIHKHLKDQDEKLETIMQRLEIKENDS